ncbi:hypothetical protein [Subsaximicrobium wynnwilliamsii]|jgi:hypothetical protein|uniref:hypothetical protein n=1 Tax=Subsaximicrobium wynnwilliamsii TaxID=291179 RepID=UPI001675F271|nr:hypothetical protein [Subsaximicrobium wynnwilliamsii]
MSDTDKKKTRKNADFQDDYHKSSNFPSLEENEGKKLEIDGDGDLKVKKADKKSDQKKS